MKYHNWKDARCGKALAGHHCELSTFHSSTCRQSSGTWFHSSSLEFDKTHCSFLLSLESASYCSSLTPILHIAFVGSFFVSIQDLLPLLLWLFQIHISSPFGNLGFLRIIFWKAGWLSDRERERGRERGHKYRAEERENFHPLVHSSNNYKSQGWAKTKSGDRNSVCNSHIDDRNSSIWAIPCCLLRYIST